MDTVSPPAGGAPAEGTSPDHPAFVTVAGRRLEYYWTRPRAAGETAILMLHEGLGSARLWRDFPAKLSARTGLPALVWSRYGYGRSDPLDAVPRPLDYLHHEALEALPDLRAQLGLDEIVLVGHSDGGSIALLHAGDGRWPVRGAIAEAPHVFVEDISIAGIEEARIAWQTTDFPERFARHHADPEMTFRGWNDTWLNPEFRDWNIEDCLPGIACPVMVIQGEGDQYGSQAQLDAIAAGSGGPVELLMLPDCGHTPHRDREDAVLDAMGRFIDACA